MPTPTFAPGTHADLPRPPTKMTRPNTSPDLPRSGENGYGQPPKR
jgi:hypothetical protein